MAAGPSAEFNSSALTELMGELSDEDAMKLLNDLCTRTPSGHSCSRCWMTRTIASLC